MSALQGQTIAVMGLGASGRAAARLAHAEGATVIGLDRNEVAEPIDGVTMQLGPHDPTVLSAADLIVVSPGIPASIDCLQQARRAGVPLIGELAFAARFATVPIIGITGTNGKSTVTWFTHQLLASTGFDPFVGGNLGRPLSEAVHTQHDVWVVEVSSYQLELPGSFRPDVGVVLNLTPDHLSRHGDMDGYALAKTDLFKSQTVDDWAILPSDSALLASAAARYPDPRHAFLGRHPGVVRQGATATVRLGGKTVSLDLSTLSVPGEHNKDNAATAALLAIAVGADPERIAGAIAGLTGLAHRMEVVADVDDVLFINDSKATNVDAARTGLIGLDRPAVVLLGGQSKGPGFDALAGLLRGQRAVITFGADGPDIADELTGCGVAVTRTVTMDDALSAALSAARPGDVVLLSPGCASFDAYRNFEHRGDVFRDLVQKTTRQETSS